MAWKLASGNRPANFSDVTLNLRKGIFELYKKENDTTINIHIFSKYTPSIIKQIPKSISPILSDNSSNIDIFNKYKHIYDNAQKKNSGYKQTLEYTAPKSKPKDRNRNIQQMRNIKHRKGLPESNKQELPQSQPPS